MNNIYSVYDYLYLALNNEKVDKSCEDDLEFSGSMIFQFIKSNLDYVNIKSNPLNENDVIYLTKHLYIPQVILDEFCDLQITNDITKCTKIIYDFYKFKNIISS